MNYDSKKVDTIDSGPKVLGTDPKTNLEVTVRKTISGPAAMKICQDLRHGNPPIYLGHTKVQEGTLLVNPLHLGQKAAAIILERIHQNFN